MLNIENLKKGDNKEYKKLYELYEKRLLRMLYDYTHNNVVSEDLLQDVVFKVFKSIHTYNPKYSFTTWIYTIAFNVIKTNLSRSEKFITCGNFESYLEFSEERSDVSKEDFDKIVEGLSYLHNEEEYDSTFIDCQLQKVVLSLPENLRNVLELIDIRGRTYKEAAVLLGMTEGTLRVNLCKARKLIGENSGTY